MPDNNFNLFYRKYFAANNVSELEEINKSICGPETETEKKIHKLDAVFDPDQQFRLHTTYPGLLVGTGYGHDYKSDDDELKNEAYKIGYYFDFATGMPVIPGSGIKGMLRSCFPQRSVTTKKELAKDENYRTARTAFIKQVIKEELKIDIEPDVDLLEDEIFHGQRNGKAIPMYKRDLFLDAVPVRIHNSSGSLFGNDYLAPHIKEGISYEASLLTNPEPIKFLKVMPGVEYRFEFRLHDSEVFTPLKAEGKLKLFKYLIETLGIGAKTNVGYGQFTAVLEKSKAGKDKSVPGTSNYKLNKETFKKSQVIEVTAGFTEEGYSFTTTGGSVFYKAQEVVHKKFEEKGSSVKINIGQKVKIRFNDNIGPGQSTANFTVLPPEN